MREQDLERLRGAYADMGIAPDRRLAARLGVNVPALHHLQDAITGDLDDEQLGIGWWAPHPGTSRRILISDHLVQCALTVSRHLVAARLHMLELDDWAERENNFMARSVTMDIRGRLRLQMPQRTRPVDDLPAAMTNVHVAGFFQSIASALDCLGAVIIGVLALPSNILRADLPRALQALGRAAGRATPGEQLQDDFSARFFALVNEVCPIAWFEWTMDFRHMVTHRGRRLQMRQFRPGHYIYGPDNRPILRTDIILHLPRDPGLSDVEEFVQRPSDMIVLTEPAELSLAGVIDSTARLIDGVSAALLDAWMARRQNINLLRQPRQQWPHGLAVPRFDFYGYAAGTAPFVGSGPGSMFITGPDTPDRLRAAALGDDQRGRWSDFD